VPVGTNLALLHLLWATLNGSFLRSRGAVFPALQLTGFTASQIRRCGQALRCGAWDIGRLVQPWRGFVLSQGQWQPHSYEGYSPLAVDLTAFWRPRLKGWVGKFFHRIANRAMKGIGLGIIAQVGRVGEQRLPLLKHIICARETDMSESQFKQHVLQLAGCCLDEHEVLVHDAGASIANMQTARVQRYVVRMALNCTARRNRLPPRKARGRRPEYGELIRPLPRRWKDRTIPATPPDVETHFRFEGRIIRVFGWRNVVRSDQKVAADNETFSIWVFFDPLYRDPLVLGTNVVARPKTIFQLYLDRWPVEQVPLVAKQLLGLQRQFVFAPASRQRLPELALLAANILTHLAAVLPPLPTGFWDRCPKRTPGRLRRVLAQTGFPKDYAFDGRIRKKRSVTAHLPKGIDAHRRQKAAR
jgi:hypothetical protein